jgi:hypothetical protein
MASSVAPTKQELDRKIIGVIELTAEQEQSRQEQEKKLPRDSPHCTIYWQVYATSVRKATDNKPAGVNWGYRRFTQNGWELTDTGSKLRSVADVWRWIHGQMDGQDGVSVTQAEREWAEEYAKTKAPKVKKGSSKGPSKKLSAAPMGGAASAFAVPLPHAPVPTYPATVPFGSVPWVNASPVAGPPSAPVERSQHSQHSQLSNFIDDMDASREVRHLGELGDPNPAKDVKCQAAAEARRIKDRNECGAGLHDLAQELVLRHGGNPNAPDVPEEHFVANRIDRGEDPTQGKSHRPMGAPFSDEEGEDVESMSDEPMDSEDECTLTLALTRHNKPAATTSITLTCEAVRRVHNLCSQVLEEMGEDDDDDELPAPQSVPTAPVPTAPVPPGPPPPPPGPLPSVDVQPTSGGVVTTTSGGAVIMVSGGNTETADNPAQDVRHPVVRRRGPDGNWHEVRQEDLVQVEPVPSEVRAAAVKETWGGWSGANVDRFLEEIHRSPAEAEAAPAEAEAAPAEAEAAPAEAAPTVPGAHLEYVQTALKEPPRSCVYRSNPPVHRRPQIPLISHVLARDERDKQRALVLNEYGLTTEERVCAFTAIESAVRQPAGNQYRTGVLTKYGLFTEELIDAFFDTGVTPLRPQQ